jgi:hypothetical protein
MNTWELSDGTKVHLGGKVEGVSLLAEFLRRGAAEAEEGHGPRIYDEPLPSESVPVDMSNARHVDIWVNDAAHCMGAIVVSAPAVEELEGQPEQSDDATLIH